MMKYKDKDNLEYVDFKTLSKEKQENSASNKIKHSNPLTGKLFKFLHSKLSGFKPEDLL